MTGLSASGKTTIARELKKKFSSFVWIDGDNFRQNVSYDLGFSMDDRRENLRRVAGFCKLLNEQGFDVITSFISPIDDVREYVRTHLKSLIVYIKCPLEVCIERDPKELYLRARQGKIPNFTGISSPFEEPKNPDVVVETDKQSVKECVQCIIKALNQKNLILSL